MKKLIFRVFILFDALHHTSTLNPKLCQTIYVLSSDEPGWKVVFISMQNCLSPPKLIGRDCKLRIQRRSQNHQVFMNLLFWKPKVWP